MPIVSTSDLCDQHGDSIQVADPIFRHFTANQQFGGQAVTIKCFEDNSLVAEAVATPGDGRILVIDGGGSLRRSLLGDNLAKKAVDNGWAGIVVYGAIRDVQEIAPMNLGVMAIGSIPRKTEKRGEGQSNVPVTFAGVTVEPGDFIYADQTGVIVAQQKLL